MEFSVCIPTYNRASYLKLALDTVITQLGDNDELVIQDNCSQDNTESVVRSYLRDSRIKYFRNGENLGLIGNFRELVNNATKEYVYLLTDDDFLLPNALDLCREFARKSKAKAFKTSYYIYNEKSNTGKLNKYFNLSLYPDDLDHEQIARIYQSAHTFTGLCFSRSLFDYDFFVKYGNVWYPSMLITGLAKSELGYLDKPTNVHVWENDTFWGIDPNRRDILNDSQIDVLLFLWENNYIDRQLFPVMVKHHCLTNHNADNARLHAYIGLRLRLKIKIHIWKREFLDSMVGVASKILN
ncbi:glycosyltransferase family 2 protein [Cyclobacterium xiamenense]|uniref:glycosyltransferase family 2 protein n=1 Tax=Cyclobacterium xiamenense TaxID=1297121 RepID=UPI0012B9FDC5|nr:glycosyltransferase family 2 protein [Cyclobacterium xiamenense]